MLLGRGRYDGDAGVSVCVPQRGCRSDKTAPRLGKGFARITVDPQERRPEAKLWGPSLGFPTSEYAPYHNTMCKSTNYWREDMVGGSEMVRGPP
jgi:hypothetical protein